MKEIPNTTFTIRVSESKQHTTASMLMLCLNNPPQGGFDLATMRARNRVADVVEKTPDGGEIKLEDSDYATAQDSIRGMRWGAAHKDILKFSELFGL